MEKSLLVGDETKIDLVRPRSQKVLEVEAPTEPAPQLIQDAIDCLEEPKVKGKSAGN